MRLRTGRFPEMFKVKWPITLTDDDSQTPKGAHASARLYSLIETARANGIEPYSYMVEVLTKLGGLQLQVQHSV